MIDKKIKQWSKGKEGNIRSLLSTLQHVRKTRLLIALVTFDRKFDFFVFVK